MATCCAEARHGEETAEAAAAMASAAVARGLSLEASLLGSRAAVKQLDAGATFMEARAYGQRAAELMQARRTAHVFYGRSTRDPRSRGIHRSRTEHYRLHSPSSTSDPPPFMNPTPIPSKIL